MTAEFVIKIHRLEVFALTIPSRYSSLWDDRRCPSCPQSGERNVISTNGDKTELRDLEHIGCQNRR